MSRSPYGRSSSRQYGWLIIPVFFVGALLLNLLVGHVLVSEGKGTRALENLGFTNVHIVDTSVLFIQFRGCSESDQAMFTVEGTDPSGTVRQLEVCAGVWKGGTIRS